MFGTPEMTAQIGNLIKSMQGMQGMTAPVPGAAPAAAPGGFGKMPQGGLLGILSGKSAPGGLLGMMMNGQGAPLAGLRTPEGPPPPPVPGAAPGGLAGLFGGAPGGMPSPTPFGSLSPGGGAPPISPSMPFFGGY